MQSQIDYHDASTAVHPDRLALDQREALAALLDRDPEAWASMQGLIAMLALAERSGGVRRKNVEVEVEPGVWRGIERVYVRHDVIVVAQGVNGHSLGWTFPQPGPVPKWQWHPITPIHGLPGDDLRR